MAVGILPAAIVILRIGTETANKEITPFFQDYLLISVGTPLFSLSTRKSLLTFTRS